MKCPYCQREVFGWTGLQELQKFEKHLPRCKKNPANVVLSDGRKTVVVPTRRQDLGDALHIRHESGQ